jgi:hypothetical protein
MYLHLHRQIFNQIKKYNNYSTSEKDKKDVK